ncbi:MAG: ABC transporter permease [Parvibaculaceae bacterium]
MTPAARRHIAIAGLAGPAYLWLAATVFLPLSAMLYFSFLTVPPIGGREAALTLRHYAAFFEKEVYWYNAWRSLSLGVWVTAICLLVGYPAAMALARHVRGRWREALFLLVILPFWSNALVRTFSWTMVLRADGIVGRWVDAILPGLWTEDILFTYPAIVIGLVHAYLPYAILTIYISLEGIGSDLGEAALSLGASPAQAFRKVTLPLSMPGVLAAVFLIFVPVIGSFMEPRILGGTNAIMLGPIIENQFVTAFNWPLGSALSFTMLAIVLLILAASAPFARRYLVRGQG